MNKNNYIVGRILKKNNKKIVVIIKKIKFIKIYKKKIFYYSKLNAFDLFNESNIGDLVIIRKSRPISKIINFILFKILEKVKLI